MAAGCLQRWEPSMCALGGSHGRFVAMQMLERSDLDFVALHRANASGRCTSRRKRGDARYVVSHGSSANRFLVVKGFAAERRIDQQIDLAGFDQVDDIRPG